MPYDSPGLAMGVPSAFQKRAVGVVTFVVVLLAVIVWPRADVAGPVLPTFLVMQQTAVVVCDSLTFLLLFVHFWNARRLGLLVLACAYAGMAILVALNLSTFPDGLAPDGATDGDSDTAAWLWNFWHALFPPAILLAAAWRHRVCARPIGACLLALAVTGVVVGLAVFFAFAGAGWLPGLMKGGAYTPFNLDWVHPLLAVVSLGTLAAVMARQVKRADYCVLNLYLSLTLLALALDVAMNWHSGARFSLGWYFGRADGTFISLLLCVGFVLEEAMLLRYVTRAARRQMEMTAALAASSAVKTRFFAAASHDLRQPFQAMRLFYEVLRTAPPDRREAALTRLGQAMTTAESLLNELLDMARLETGKVTPKPETVCLGRLLQEIAVELEPAAARKGLSLAICPVSVAVVSDRALLRRILTNLAANAIRYTRRGGVLIGLRRRPGGVVVEVWDTGIGIAEDHLPHIFEELYQVGNTARDRSQGLGMGLAVVQKLSDLLDCQVSVGSRPGRGSVFRLFVPLHADERPSEEANPVAPLSPILLPPPPRFPASQAYNWRKLARSNAFRAGKSGGAALPHSRSAVTTAS